MAYSKVSGAGLRTLENTAEAMNKKFQGKLAIIVPRSPVKFHVTYQGPGLL